MYSNQVAEVTLFWGAVADLRSRATDAGVFTGGVVPAEWIRGAVRERQGITPARSMAATAPPSAARGRWPSV
jgi:hypothetical protein